MVFKENANEFESYISELNAKNDVGQTPLHMTQDLLMLKLLISSGADVNNVDGDGRTPIFNKEIESDIRPLLRNG